MKTKTNQSRHLTYMKTFISKRIYGAALAMLVAAAGASAQNLMSGYFDNNYLYRFQANPAMANERNFVAMPGLGNLNLATNGTLSMSTVLYNIDGRTTTFLNPKVDAAGFLDKVKDKNRIGVNLRETILAGGWKAWGGYNTIAIGARADVGIYMPGDLLRLAKLGAENSSYNIGNTGASATGWAEISLGHSRKINKQWRVGMNVKALVGLGNINADFRSAVLTLGEDSWAGEVDAELNASVKNLTYKTKYNRHTERDYVSGMDLDSFGVNGGGVAFDLGAVFTLNKDWEFSASLLDLGFIHWSNNMTATTNGVRKVETDDYSFNVDDDTSFDKFKDDLSMLYQLTDEGDQGGRTTALGATMNLGAQYTFPLYKKLKFGLTNTTRIQGEYSWTDFRLSANVQPVKCFSAGVNLGVGTFGPSFGWIVNYNTPGFNLFLASDRTPGKLAKQGVPLNSNINVNLGISFPF